MPSRTLHLASLGGLTAAFALLLGLLGPAAAAAPADPFNGVSTAYDEPAEPGAPVELASGGVVEQRGTRSYTVQLAVPPGRNGMAPDLALRYTSGGRLRGGLAVGWTLDIPSVTRDTSLGHTTVDTFSTTFGRAGRLLQVPDLAPSGGTAYRVDHDDAFTRFSFQGPGRESTWTALGQDGRRHVFGQGIAAGDHVGRWLLSSSTDAHGNTVRYGWGWVLSGNMVDYKLMTVEYASNAGAGLAAYAKVAFSYAPLDLCTGSTMPIGAAAITGDRPAMEGAAKLDAVTTSVRDTASAPWRTVRRVALEYTLRSSTLHFPILAPPPAPTRPCTQAPLRYLDKVAVTGFDRIGTATALPATTFSYNDRLNAAAPNPSPFPPPPPLASPGFGDYGSTKGATGRLLDLDGDGVRDRLSVVERSSVCMLEWQKGILGGTFEATVRTGALPTTAWHRPRLGAEQCTFNGQVAYKNINGSSSVRGLVSYHFLDYTGDGRVDLLTNVWAQAVHDRFVPHNPPYGEAPEWDPSWDSTAGGLLAPMVPEGSPFRWRVYRNIRDPQAWSSPGLPDLPFSRLSLTVEGPRWASSECSPGALAPSGNDAQLDLDHVPAVSIPSLVDLDGDGFLDVVDAGSSARVLRFGTPWCVWFGNGGTRFTGGLPGVAAETPYRWSVPTVNALVHARGYNEEVVDENGTRHVTRSTGVALRDLDGDSHPDLVLQGSDGRLVCYYGTGDGFRPTPVDLGVVSPVEAVQTDYAYAGSAPGALVTEGARGYRVRLLDADGDGLLDLLSFPADDLDVTQVQAPFARFNAGGSFLPRVQLTGAWVRAQQLYEFDAGTWKMLNDVADADGDGLDDLASWSSDGRQLTLTRRPGLPAAPDLLNTVDNGSGGALRTAYGLSSDPAVVARSQVVRDSGHLPGAAPVVIEARSDAGFGTPERATRYTYGPPVYASPAAAGATEREHARFLGFGTATAEVRAGDAGLRRTAQTFVYGGSAAPPEGVLVDERVVENVSGAWRPHTITTHTYQGLPLFGGRTTFVPRVASLTRTCAPGATQTQCAAQTVDVHRTGTSWQAVTPADVSGVALYVRAAESEGAGLGVGRLDRRTRSTYQVRYGQSPWASTDYRVLLTESLQEGMSGTGTAFTTFGRTVTTYDAAGLAVRSDDWLSSGRVATTRRTFDTPTGTLRSISKPAQVAAGTGASTRLDPDVNALFVATTTDELGHQVHTTHDLATGALLTRRGPNSVVLGSGSRAWEGETWQVDGLGRTITHGVSRDDATAGYVIGVVDKMSYLDAELPRRVHSERLQDRAAGVWTTDDRTSDGAGRLLRTSTPLGDGRTAVSTRRYDADGNLAAMDVPDPRVDDGTRVTYRYAHDGLGRLTGLTRPDGTGRSVSYAGLSRTSRDVINGIRSTSATQSDSDVLGRLVAVTERSASTSARSSYSYDNDDDLVRIEDADGAVTTLRHDWRGHRIGLTRSGRSWAYAYDLNGNLNGETAPVLGGQVPRPVTYTFDDLDRTRTERSSGPGTSGTETTTYAYDTGRNGIGRLAGVVLPAGSIRYGYDAGGRVASESRTVDLGTSASLDVTQQVTRSYNDAGQLTLSRWSDGQRSRLTYDGRGLVDSVLWEDPVSGSWKRVADYQRSLAGEPRSRTGSFGQNRTYGYDVLGRVVSDAVTIAGATAPVATRSYSFTGRGDLASVTGSTAGRSAAGAYTYDAQHRLLTATGPNGYDGAFTYSPAGNLRTARVGWNGSPDARDVTYGYAPSNPQAVTALTSRVSGATYAGFSYDAAGNMLEKTMPGRGLSLRWDPHSRLRQATTATGEESYRYDHTGARMLAVTKAGTARFWFGEREFQYAADGRLTRRYHLLSDGATTVARVGNDAKLELQYADALQNLMLAVSASGEVTANLLYGPHGELVQGSGGDDHTRRANGKEVDGSTGLRYYGARYYDPIALRWNSADPLFGAVPDLGLDAPQRLNLYSFSLNNPLRYYDPDGLEGEDTSGSDGAADGEGATCEAELDECTAGDDSAEPQAEPGGEADLAEQNSSENEGQQVIDAFRASGRSLSELSTAELRQLVSAFESQSLPGQINLDLAVAQGEQDIRAREKDQQTVVIDAQGVVGTKAQRQQAARAAKFDEAKTALTDNPISAILYGTTGNANLAKMVGNLFSDTGPKTSDVTSPPAPPYVDTPP